MALNPFDDKGVCLNPIKCLPWDNHTQKVDSPCIYCLEFVMLYQKELTENKTIEEIYLYVQYLEETLNQYQSVKLIRDRAESL